MSPTTVVVGSSVGGVRTAQALRAAGYPGDVVLVGEEPDLPYDKPPLSKALLAGTASTQDIGLLTQQAAVDAGIRLVLGRAAIRLDVDARVVELADGERLGYDDLVIATGARARPSPWGELPGVHVLRTLDDAVALRADLLRGGPLIVIGAGFIGAEVAATARTTGVDVTIVDPAPVAMSRVLEPADAMLFGLLHERQGVATRFGYGVTGIDRTEGALRVRLADGSTLPAAAVVVGIGAVPNDGWLASSGLRIDDGVVCDRYGRAVDAPRIHAVGDVARWFHPRHDALVRVEHWTNAVEQAACVAHNITHPEDLRAHSPVEYVWSDQYDWKIQLAGRTGGSLDHVIVDGADPTRSFAVLYAGTDGRLRGAVTANWPKALVLCRRALAGGASLDDTRGAVAAATVRTTSAGVR
ncbi:MAG: pyridine nucleotide-disulfide oxidoreductase [Pseudonocardia sp.]|uniref:NAD(P)/FAD-dependent oxidoreductase n=1 Tax=Pseudonocardia sp. TaxID=60912 RepID=UPI002619E7E0|nr:FAD-dependent oxidoreductase [Pseudonocardia sp.]MCU1629217.1 pyridine nucleotide-disulfide oxidoreductase [Pseudonocardia sp.]